MKVQVTGKVVEVEHRSWVNQDGQTVKAFDAFLASENPRFGADRISGSAEIAPKAGDVVNYNAIASARVSKGGRPWLSVWAFEKA